MKVFTTQLLFHFLIVKMMKSQNKTQAAYTFSFLNWLLEGKKKKGCGPLACTVKSLGRCIPSSRTNVPSENTTNSSVGERVGMGGELLI